MFTVTYQPSAPTRVFIGRPWHRGERGVGQQSAEVRHALGRPSPQPKLSVGPANDRFEQEADRVADQVMGMADSDGPAVAGTAGDVVEPPVQRLCAPCEEAFEEAEREERPVEADDLCPGCQAGTVQRSIRATSADPAVIRRTPVSPYSIDDARVVGEEEETLQTKADTSSPTAAGVVSTAAIRFVIKRGGRPLPDGTRAFMEHRFGHDFSGVRIHADGAADEAAGAINARAFTLGRSIVFAQGQYAPHSHAGWHLLAHELTHVVQQGGGARHTAAPTIQRDDHAAMVRRVRWGTARDTGVDAYPWNDDVRGDVYAVETDAGNAIDAWKPHDGTTYWCHGFTFGGADDSGGPFSIWGSDVPQVLGDDGWRLEESCRATPEDILVFYLEAPNQKLTHSGVVESVVAPAVIVDESRSLLDSKWGQAPQNQRPWLDNVRQYGRYQVYSKAPVLTPCAGSGANEGWEDLGEEADCPPTPTGLGYRTPSPSCERNPDKDIGRIGRHIRFCLDSDEMISESPGNVMVFANAQPADANFVVHGYASRDGSRAYNEVLACHRTNRVRRLLLDAGIPPARIETASKGPTDEFSGGPEFNRVAVVWPEVRRFGQHTPDPACPQGSTGLGDVQPDPRCPDDPQNLLDRCEQLPANPAGERPEECDFYHFCRDSDVLRPINTPADIAAFARRQAAGAFFTVHGFASVEGGHDYNVRLSCHRAKRVARELMNAGVPPEQIDIAGKGPSAQIAGGLESNRIVIVNASPPAAGPEPALPTRTGRKTQEEKHALIDAAIENINRGMYALAADAYLSFWTCGRVPTLRHAVATTHYLAEGDPGTPRIEREPGIIIPGRSSGLGLNNVVVSNQILEGHPQCIRDAVARLAFRTKVRDEEFGRGHGRGSERAVAAEHMVFLAGLSCETHPQVTDPRAARPPPACLGPLPPTLHGTPTTAEKAARVPEFRVEAFDALTTSGASRMEVDALHDRLILATAELPLLARGTVSLHNFPHEHRNYDVGVMITVTRDETDITYAGGEELRQQLPVPLRDTDGRRPREPWFADDAVEVPEGGRAEPLALKFTGQVLPLHFEGGGQQGSIADEVTRHAEFQVWLVARRHGAPLDRFATHILAGTAVRFEQDLDVSAPAGRGGAVTGSGSYRTRTSIAGSDSSVLRYSGPVAEDLEPRETTTIDRVPPCEAAFNSVRLTLSRESASSVSGVIGPTRRQVGGGPVVVSLAAVNPVTYTPQVNIQDLTGRAPLDKFEVGLVQNILSINSEGRYSSGEIVHEQPLGPLPQRDGAPPHDPFAHELFMSTREKELGRFSVLRREVGLELGDVPGIGFFENLATHPLCPGLKQGTLRHMTGRHRFRTWVVVRFDENNGCMKKLHHIDWQMDWSAAVNPDNVERSAMTVTAQGSGRPVMVIGDVLPTKDDACEP